METKRLLEHWQDEGDFHFLYQKLERVEEDFQRRAFFRDMAAIELRHQEIFAELLEKRGVARPAFRPGLRVRLLGLVARFSGIETVLPTIIRSEARETQEFLQESIHAQGAAREVVGQMARESSEHAQQLMRLGGQDGEPWHRVGSGGFVRSVVYGFNDGLTANFGLVMAVIGAQVDHHVLLVSGLAGMIADALSMGSSGYLAAKSEQEVYAHEIRMENEELEIMPDLETEELAILYRGQGLDEQAARERAEAIMQDKSQALKEKVRLELGLNPDMGMSALKEGGITGATTAVGAFIPILPFMFFTGVVGIVISFIISMLSHFLVGASRSVFTGRGVIRSGMDMFLVGLGVALVGYLFGDLFVRLLS
jgi:VIT1/CCC1 family predicted Fe2+/Mn2+ transporter